MLQRREANVTLKSMLSEQYRVLRGALIMTLDIMGPRNQFDKTNRLKTMNALLKSGSHHLPIDDCRWVRSNAEGGSHDVTDNRRCAAIGTVDSKPLA